MSEQNYLNLLQEIMDHGVDKGDRTGTGMREIFGAQLRFRDIGNHFPLITTKKMFLKAIKHELLWFLKGDTNIKYLNDNGVKIWDQWADKNGNLGPVYGAQWRKWYNPIVTSDGYDVEVHDEPIDQIAELIEEIKTKPDSRRMTVVAWNPSEISQMALPPCHCLFQFSVQPHTWQERFEFLGMQQGVPNDLEFDYSKIMDSNHQFRSDVKQEDIEYLHQQFDLFGLSKGKLHCHLYQRSADMFLGVPFNIASYALLTQMIAQVCDLDAGDFIHTFGSAHIYHNHFDQVKEQLSRTPMTPPQMKLNSDIKDIDDFRFEDFTLENYIHYNAIKAPIAV